MTQVMPDGYTNELMFMYVNASRMDIPLHNAYDNNVTLGGRHADLWGGDAEI